MIIYYFISKSKLNCFFPSICNQYPHSIYVPTWFKTLVCVSFVSICFPYPLASCRFSTRKSRQYLILFWIFELVTIIDFSAPVCYFSKLRSIWGPLLWTGQWPHIDHWVTTTPRWSRTEDGIKERITRIHMAPRGCPKPDHSLDTGPLWGTRPPANSPPACCQRPTGQCLRSCQDLCGHTRRQDRIYPQQDNPCFIMYTLRPTGSYQKVCVQAGGLQRVPPGLQVEPCADWTRGS